MDNKQLISKVDGLFESIRLSGPGDKFEDVHSGVYYRRGKYFEAKVSRHAFPGWRNEDALKQKHRYEVKYYDKTGKERGTDILGRRDARRKLGFLPGSKISQKFALDDEGLKKFDSLKKEYQSAACTADAIEQ